ncbi:hypothetical protein WAX74_01360 [Psychrobacillus sp. FJAT-51614]|uniref:Uncharacterized protein n=1 Tax=Psychrobacillus mangrovi TaxID=3117745 RepID=A0ABU8EZW7_9BACI
MNENVIAQYKEEENVMISLFAQWCVNHNLDAAQLYNKAYPLQQDNELLLSIIEITEKNSLHVDTETLMQVLQLFGNDDLAIEVFQAAENRK